MIEPRCLIEDDGRPRLLRDDFAVGQNGFIGPACGPDAPVPISPAHITACSGRRGFRNRRQTAEKRKPGWGSSFRGNGDSLTIDNRCGHGKLRFMAKKKISSTDLIWIFHERLKAFDDHPLHGIPIAIVPLPSAGWTALTPKNVRLHRPLWENRVRAIEKELRNNYVLKG
jgi:hypothetical protein